MFQQRAFQTFFCHVSLILFNSSFLSQFFGLSSSDFVFHLFFFLSCPFSKCLCFVYLCKKSILVPFSLFPIFESWTIYYWEAVTGRLQAMLPADFPCNLWHRIFSINVAFSLYFSPAGFSEATILFRMPGHYPPSTCPTEGLCVWAWCHPCLLFHMEPREVPRASLVPCPPSPKSGAMARVTSGTVSPENSRWTSNPQYLRMWTAFVRHSF